MTDIDPTLATDLINAFRRSKVMFVAVSLGIFDRLQAGAQGAAGLALQTGTQPHALERLLDACVGLGLVRKESGCYANQPVAETYLCRSSPETLARYVRYSNRALYPLWCHLEDALREGTSRWAQAFGLEGSLFDHFFSTEEAKRDFLAGMHGFGLLSSPRVVAAFDLTPYRKLVDLGGGTGHLAMAACQNYPALRAAVFDMPGAIEVAREYVNRSGLARIELIAGDFFNDPLPPSDFFSLGRVLHDWSEERIRLLLKKVRDSLPHQGALLIAERLLNEDKTGPLEVLTQSLSMLVCTEGKERTLQEYTALLRDAGFSTVIGHKTSAAVDAILAIKA